MRELIWMGDSLSALRAFPEAVRAELGYALLFAQMGLKAEAAKPFKGLAGVWEIVAPFDGTTFRAVYALKIGERIYVLHAFQKKSKSGIKTPQREIELITARFKDAKRSEEEDA